MQAWYWNVNSSDVLFLSCLVLSCLFTIAHYCRRRINNSNHWFTKKKWMTSSLFFSFFTWLLNTFVAWFSIHNVEWNMTVWMRSIHVHCRSSFSTHAHTYNYLTNLLIDYPLDIADDRIHRLSSANHQRVVHLRSNWWMQFQSVRPCRDTDETILSWVSSINWYHVYNSKMNSINRHLLLSCGASVFAYVYMNQLN
jgi:hypothetical protein